MHFSITRRLMFLFLLAAIVVEEICRGAWKFAKHKVSGLKGRSSPLLLVGILLYGFLGSQSAEAITMIGGWISRLRWPLGKYRG